MDGDGTTYAPASENTWVIFETNYSVVSLIYKKMADFENINCLVNVILTQY